MNNINGINNISSNQIYNSGVGRNFNSGSGLEIPQDNVNINNQNIKVLIEKLISQYLNNSNVGNNIPQNGGYSSLSDDELLRLILLLLQYANQNGNIGNNLGNEPNLIATSLGVSSDSFSLILSAIYFLLSEIYSKKESKNI